jgi:manganese transport protein
MKKFFGLALGIIASLGGFVDIGDLVFSAQAGAKFGYSLLWALLVGTIGIMVYGEMSGRVAAVGKVTVFDIIRATYPPKLGFFTLVMSQIVNIMTCAAEIGGVALILSLLSGYSYALLIPAAALGLIAVIWFLPFKGIERLFGYLGVGLALFLIVAIKTAPGLHEIAHGLVPHGVEGSQWLSYFYFAVGLIAATLMPYEVYFYSSGGIEEKWKTADISQNRINSMLGFGLGALVAGGVIVAAANVLGPMGVEPQFIGTTPLAVVGALGKFGLLLALLGMLFAIGGSAVETAFASAYNLCQFAGWKWGRRSPPLETPRFTWAWLIVLILSGALILTGLDPISLTEYAVIFSVVIMPLTYFPVFIAARNSQLMGRYKNGRLANTMGVICLIIICLVALAAIPLMFLTSRGQ